ncbi:TatD family hydrolase [Paenibacillus sp. IB182496]|uniref:TatD family hydrolase n=1 Tax=Paenibacillus sabuli TaxID=2772509 RepID=A0A927GS35_9BACL|nr:TatD family hydrolase [Paenibacillus sabuli]MBD2846138.1 TatD family hydrolase [Paenibacillus sabuli]
MSRPDRQPAIVDAHLHLDLYEPAEREAVLRDASAGGVGGIVAVSMDLASAEAVRALALRHPALVMPAYGYHPEQPLPEPQQEEALIAWIRARYRAGERFAIGEVGLPYYTRTERAGTDEPLDEAPYVRLLDRFAALAAELDRPLALHAVYEDADKACELLKRHGVRRAHFHWFKGPEHTIRRMIAAGYRISVTPDVAYEPDIRALVQRYPLELMMTETDGPWRFEGPYSGRPTRPSMVRDVAAHIAALKGLEPAETARRLAANARTFYRMDVPAGDRTT